ncbi:hypothetical protein T484DRAFT_1826412 [Baffinella frigidus]|nr:hypothetical protein T484DRAFT_1826412 [Cryptophyta sp. CCMP2293]
MNSPPPALAPEESMGGDDKRPAGEEAERPSEAAGGAVRSTLGPDGAPFESCLPPLPKNLSPATAWKDVCEMAKAMARVTPDVGFKRTCDILSEEEFLRARLTRVSNLIGFCHPPTPAAPDPRGLRKHSVCLPQVSPLLPCDTPATCFATSPNGVALCGLPALPFSSYCSACILHDAEQVNATS